MAGFYLGVGALLHPARRSRFFYMALGFSWLFTAFGRIVSMMSDRGNTLYNWISTVLELVLAALAAGLRLRPSAMNCVTAVRASLAECDKLRRNACQATCCGLRKPVLDGIRLSTGGCGARTLASRKNRSKAKDLASQFGWLRESPPVQLRQEKRRSVAKSSSPISGIAERYAGSLFDLAIAVERRRRGRRPISAASRSCLPAAPISTRMIKSPVFSADDQFKAIAAIADKAGIGGLVGNFLRVVASNRRLFAVPGNDQGLPPHRRRAPRRDRRRSHFGASADGRPRRPSSRPR